MKIILVLIQPMGLRQKKECKIYILLNVLGSRIDSNFLQSFHRKIVYLFNSLASCVLPYQVRYCVFFFCFIFFFISRYSAFNLVSSDLINCFPLCSKFTSHFLYQRKKIHIFRLSVSGCFCFVFIVIVIAKFFVRKK